MLIESGKLKVSKSDLKVTYHDPCELGRGRHIYEEPRKVLQAVSTLLKISDEKENSLCCGMNLGNTVLTLEQQTTIRDNTLACLNEPNPDVIATACPMCKRAFQHGTNANVKDIAEIVADQIEK